MSTTYPAFRAAVKAAVVEASGLDAGAVVWAQDGAPVADPYVKLTVISDARTNDVPVRETLESDGDSYTKTLSEMRDVAVQIQVESIDADAVGLANEIQLRLHRQDARDLLEAECVFVEDGPGIQDLRYRDRDMWIQVRAFDIRLRIVLEDTDPTPVGTIGTVKVQGESIDLPPEISLTEDTISEDY